MYIVDQEIEEGNQSTLINFFARDYSMLPRMLFDLFRVEKNFSR